MAAKRGYLKAFRKSIERKDVSPGDVRLNVADLQTVETLIGELADPDEKRVIYAIDILESLDKRNLITPLLLYHESPRVRARALTALAGASPEVADRWLPNVQRMLKDTDVEVRTAAVGALASMRSSSVADLVRPFLDGDDPHLAATAAAVLAKTGQPADVDAAEATLTKLAADANRPDVRRDVAAAVGQIGDTRFNQLLVPLLYDGEASVAEEAMKGVRQLKGDDFSFVPTLVSLLRHRQLKGAAREVLIGYGDAIVPTLAYFLNDGEENVWVRRHIPATLASIGTQAAMDTLTGALATAKDGFLRFKLVEAIERLHRAAPALTYDPKPFEPMVSREAHLYFQWLSLRFNLFSKAGLPAGSLLDRALGDKLARTTDRLWRLLSVLYPPADMDAARAAIAGRDVKARSSALEYLDNVFAGPIRKKVLPIFDEMPLAERVRKGNVIISSRPRDAEETLLQLINDEDEIIASAAIYTAAEQKMWSLADDIEHVLAHRDAKDWYVFEAASWALAAQRMPDDRRRSLWNEPLPAVEVAARLASTPVFATTWVAELFRIAGSGRQVRHGAGTVLYQEGQSPESLQFLLDGSVALSWRDGTTTEAVPTAALAFEEVVQNKAMRATVRTATRTICLSLTVDECRGLLSENPDLVEGLFRSILDDPAFAAGASLVKGTGEEAVRLAGDGISPIEKVMALQRISTFAHFRTDELLALANAARRVSLEEGKTVFGEGAPPSLWILVTGEMALEHASAPRIDADPGDAVGLYETLAGRPAQRSARVTRPGIALRIDREELFEALGERPAMLQQLFTALFGARGSAESTVAA
jgi:CRP-like cAMP-binding protein